MKEIFHEIKATGLLVGMIIGAGIFALPYTIAQAGLFWSLIYFLFVAIVVTLMHVWYGRVYIAHHEKLRLPGYMGHYFGRPAYVVSLWSRVASYLGYLVAYGILSGFFLEHIFVGVSPWFLTVCFFLVSAPLLFLSLASIVRINFILVIPLVIFACLLFVVVLPSMQFSQRVSSGVPGGWFLPYGVFLFAMSGASAIPEVVDTLKKRNKKNMNKIAVMSTIIVSLVYILFTAAVLGSTHGTIPEDGISSLAVFGSGILFYVGTIFGLCAIVTSYMALALELRFTFEYDMKMQKKIAWFIVAILPLILFVLGMQDFVFLVSLVGALGVGVEGICIALLAYRAGGAGFMISSALAISLLVGALFEVVRVFGIV